MNFPHLRYPSGWSCWLPLSVSLLLVPNVFAVGQSPTGWQAGAARIDITPTRPVRLSGYGSRTQSTDQVDDPLHVRALALRFAEQAPLVLVSIDAIGLSATLTDRVTAMLHEQNGLERHQVVFCTSHSHTAPQLEDLLPNLFTVPLRDDEREEMMRYSQRLVESIAKCVDQSLQRLQPSEVVFGLGRAEFAINRRMIQGKVWTGFGTVDHAPVDRTVRVIHAKRTDGTTIAVAYQYACHCTSISPEFNRIGGDWAGLSANMLEERISGDGSDGVVALPIIGCGADANPNPRGTYADAVQHAKEMAQSVQRICRETLAPLPAPTAQTFQLVALASERPTRDQLNGMLQKESYVERNFATRMLAILAHKDRLPETYPAPVHMWQFGDTLAWVFMGGEVVVDYQLRLEKELSRFANVWVAAYVDDVFAYVASERVRSEGGYEVDGSMLYYAQPGRWVSGTEEVLVARILGMANDNRRVDMPMKPIDSLHAIEVPKGWSIDMVACEPLVEDPVNIAFGADGSVWVVEMGDYPSGGSRTGQIKRLIDSDGDGQLDQGTVFLKDLSFPAGIYPWRDGIVVACAPDVFLARDTDHDGIADERTVLLTGFPLANPQHRVNGFTYGLDHRLHLGVGSDVGEITEVATGRRLNVGGCDLSLDVDIGRAFVESGSTQYIRGCDAWGNWFGNDNSHPIYHYVWDHRWLAHPRGSIERRTQHLMQPPSAPPVHPLTRDADRFNDLFAANRFTSACGTIFCDSPGAGPEMQGCALVCESVHNLVARIDVQRAGASFVGRRFPEDAQSEWMRSRDPWFRPVRVENGPDGSIWVVDMYRRVIEHPQWIPDEWQQRMDLRAGDDMGRIYRVYRSDCPSIGPTDWSRASIDVLLQGIQSPSSKIADLARQQLVWRGADSLAQAQSIRTGLRHLLQSSTEPVVRLRAMAGLHATGQCTFEDWQLGCRDPDPRVVRWVIETLSKIQVDDTRLGDLILEVAGSRPAKESSPLGLQLIASLAMSPMPDYGLIGELLQAHAGDKWVDQSIQLIPQPGIDRVVERLLDQINDRTAPLVDQLVVETSDGMKKRLLREIGQASGLRPAWHFTLGKLFVQNDSNELRLSGSEIERLVRDAQRIIADVRGADDLRIAALNFWGSVASTGLGPEELLPILSAPNSERLHRVAVDWLVRSGSERMEAIAEHWSELSPSVPSSLITGYLSRDRNVLPLLEQVRLGRIPKEQVQASHLERLRSDQTAEVQGVVDGLFGPPPGADRSAIVAEYVQRWPSRINPERGESLFKQHCAQCHRDRFEGGELVPSIGPNLQALSNWKNEAWVVGILDPNQAVEPKYRRSSLRTEDGKTLTGIIVHEDELGFELVNDQGVKQFFARESIEESRMSNKSLMPEGLERILSPEDVASIVGHLRKLR